MKKFILSLLLAFVACITVFAEQTPYEKKIESIYIKYYCLATYGYNGGLTAKDLLSISVVGTENAASLALMKYGMMYDAQQAVQWSDAMEDELEAAKSLMTDEDYHKIFLNTSYGKVMSIVKKQFDQKYVKDVFETQAQFEERARRTAGKEYDLLCEKLIAKMNSTLMITITPKSYDAERGIYKVGIKASANVSDEKAIELSSTTLLSMPPYLARNYDGEIIEPVYILSVDWVVMNNEISIGKFKYIDIKGNFEEFDLGHKTAKPLVFDYDKYREKQPLLPGHTWAAASMKNYYEEYYKRLRTIIEEYNERIKTDKNYHSNKKYLLKRNHYNLGIVDKYDEVRLQEALAGQEKKIKRDYEMNVANMKLAAMVVEYNQKIKTEKYYSILNSEKYFLKTNKYFLDVVDKNDEILPQEALAEQEKKIKRDYEMNVANMKEDCRKSNPDEFISIYANEHLDFANKLAVLAEDYKCYNYSYNKLAFYVIDGMTPRDTKCFDKYIGLFNSSDEFYSYYSDVNLFSEEVTKRDGILKKYQFIMKELNQTKKLTFKGAKDSKYSDMQMIISSLDEFKIVEKWYDDALNACFNVDSKMMKEYEKVGYLFASKSAFFQSYTSSSYKNDLKNAKKSRR